MRDFSRALAGSDVLVFDGAMGTELQKRGMPPGVSPELYALSHPEVVRSVHRDYLRAGAAVATTNTFGGTRHKLPRGHDVTAFNREMTLLARAEAGDTAFVAGSVGPTGKFCQPLGPLSPRDMVAAFAEQIRGLAEGGADFIIAETHFDLAEAKAMVLACREVCRLPVAVCMTFEGRASLTGSSPEVFADTMANLGVDLIGVNCGMGPEGMRDVVLDWLPRLATPFLVKPNAGLPRLENGRTVFPMGPEEFAAETARFVDLGAAALSGCCGTSPAHIAALAGAVRGRTRTTAAPTDRALLVLTSRSVSVPMAGGHPCAVIGERINPTGKKVLAGELASGSRTEALRLAGEQLEAGATVLDVNVGAPMVDEKTVLPGLVGELVKSHAAPLSLDSNDAEALEAGLWSYPGSPLVNSISGEPGRMARLGPLCARHGAPFILLPLKGRHLPVAASERIAIIEELLDEALAMGVPKRLILVDALALTVSSKPEAALACLETIRHCAERLGLPTTLGLSNISFGLPARELLNAVFLSMCLSSGLSAVIANPNAIRLREALGAAEVLLGRDPQAGRFIAGFAGWTPGGGSVIRSGGSGGEASEEGGGLEAAVVRGRVEAVLAGIEAALAEGRAAGEILATDLIPGIMEVGRRYERKEYFLPQLLRSAEAMRAGFERLKPLLAEGDDGRRAGRIVLATVEGDIHDIGKNIVGLMLGNHGFEVLDLGKDVSADRIVEEALRVDADLIGLSALMTTTMTRMEDTVRLCRERDCRARVLIGGAVVTDAFARSIGADGFATDAVDAVRKAGELINVAGTEKHVASGQAIG